MKNWEIIYILNIGTKEVLNKIINIQQYKFIFWEKIYDLNIGTKGVFSKIIDIQQIQFSLFLLNSLEP
jgi:predicted nucleic-acid-binding Zn-ribbon protein